MNETQNKKLTPLAQRLREKMTPEEKHLWYDFLKKIPWTVNRQKVFGNYIVDFYIASANLVIEVDGGQHNDEETILRDKERGRLVPGTRNNRPAVFQFGSEAEFNLVCIDILEHLPGLPFTGS